MATTKPKSEDKSEDSKTKITERHSDPETVITDPNHPLAVQVPEAPEAPEEDNRSPEEVFAS